MVYIIYDTTKYCTHAQAVCILSLGGGGGGGGGLGMRVIYVAAKLHSLNVEVLSCTIVHSELEPCAWYWDSYLLHVHIHTA